ncbi:MAG TPA: proton-conducting transporter membrane subunit [Thermoanaerobaculia bacterium]
MPFAGSSTAGLPLLVTAAILFLASGVPGLFMSWRSAWGPRLAAALVVAGATLGLAGAALALGAAGGAALTYPLPVPGGRGELGADALGAFFAVPVLVVGALGSLYGMAYWRPAKHPRNGRRLRLCYGILLGSMILVTLARDGVSFLVAWEAMAVSTFFLVTTEEVKAPTRRAGWIYLLFSHGSILCLLAMFLLLAQLAGGFSLQPLAAAPAPLAWAVFVLAVAGFGVKAGMMPLHTWLPGAHAAAPSHVSALMSGVVIKMGVYGLVRVCGLLPSPPPGWGAVLLSLGAVSAFLGVVFALSQHDIKRLLAYHSIENIGIIVLGLGLAMVGRSLGRPDWVLLGLGGCLLHVWNHALFKPLLFFGAGSVARAVRTREIERMGGLAKRMPATAACFLLGSIAISGLPPLNGFASELLVYLGLVRTAAGGGASWLPAALAVPVLAAVGALAVACFVKVYGIVFLGVPRTAAAARAHESGRLMLAPMVLLAVACTVLGVLPWAAAPALERAALAWAPGQLAAAPALAELAPLYEITAVALLVAAILAVLSPFVLPAVRRGRRREPALPTWDCGYATASARVQYTGSSFADLITSRFDWVLRPHVDRPGLLGLFPAAARFETHVEDPVMKRLLQPATHVALRLSGRFRAAHQGQLQRYLLYVLLAIVAVLSWSMLAG